MRKKMIETNRGNIKGASFLLFFNFKGENRALLSTPILIKYFLVHFPPYNISPEMRPEHHGCDWYDLTDNFIVLTQCPV